MGEILDFPEPADVLSDAIGVAESGVGALVRQIADLVGTETALELIVGEAITLLAKATSPENAIGCAECHGRLD